MAYASLYSHIGQNQGPTGTLVLTPFFSRCPIANRRWKRKIARRLRGLAPEETTRKVKSALALNHTRNYLARESKSP
jgi:hypothetical protein